MIHLKRATFEYCMYLRGRWQLVFIPLKNPLPIDGFSWKLKMWILHLLTKKNIIWCGPANNANFVWPLKSRDIPRKKRSDESVVKWVGVTGNSRLGGVTVCAYQNVTGSLLIGYRIRVYQREYITDETTEVTIHSGY